MEIPYSKEQLDNFFLFATIRPVPGPVLVLMCSPCGGYVQEWARRDLPSIVDVIDAIGKHNCKETDNS